MQHSKKLLIQQLVRICLIPVTVLTLPVGSLAGEADGLTCHTKSRMVIVDLTSDGQPRYRVWNAPHSPKQQPDLLLMGGSRTVEGTGPCTHAVWSFRAGHTLYTVSQLGCTEKQPPIGATGQLAVFSNGQLQQSWWCF